MEERSPKYPRTLCTVSHFIWKTKKNDKSILITVLHNTVTEREDNVQEGIICSNRRTGSGSCDRDVYSSAGSRQWKGDIGSGITQHTDTLSDKDLIDDIIQSRNQHGDDAGDGKLYQKFGFFLISQWISSGLCGLRGHKKFLF